MGNKGMHINSTPAQKANLRVFGKSDPEWEREQQSKGGKASQKAKAEKRTFKEAVQWLMELDAFETENEAVEKLREKFPTLTNAQAMSAAVMHKAIVDGDARAYQTIRDTSGETPSTLVDLNSNEPMVINIKTVD